MTSDCSKKHNTVSVLGCACRNTLGIWGSKQTEEADLTVIRGIDYLTNRRLNKGLAFSKIERIILGIEGLLPPVVRTIDEQVLYLLRVYYRLKHRFQKYLFLMNIYDRNEQLFFKCVLSNLKLFLKILYVPTIGHVCKDYSALHCFQRGMIITINDKKRVYDLLKNWPEPFIRCIVVTNGQNVFGIGDMGINSMAAIIGKSILYTAVGGVKPNFIIPCVLDMGTNNTDVYTDPHYTGLKRKRCSREDAEALLEEFMDSVVMHFGSNCFINYTFFNHSFARNILKKYKDDYLLFSEDIEGTACAIMAALLTAIRIKQSTLDKEIIFFYGAGFLMQSVARLCVIGMMKLGLKEEEAIKKIWGMDEHGLLVTTHPNLWLQGGKFIFAQKTKKNYSLIDNLKNSKATILIGTKNEGGAFTKEVLCEMAQHDKNPVIFALSSPKINVECTAEEAYTCTDGKCIFASTVYFSKYFFQDVFLQPQRITKLFTSAGIVLGVVVSYINAIHEGLIYNVANRLSELVSRRELEKGYLYPDLQRVSQISAELALIVVNYAIKHELTVMKLNFPDKLAFIKSQLYNPDYSNLLPRHDQINDDPNYIPPKKLNPKKRYYV